MSSNKDSDASESKTTTRMPHGDARRTGPALEAMYQLTRWLIPTLDRFPRRQKFLLGDRIQNTALTGLERLVEATFTRNRARLLDRVNVDLDKLRVADTAVEGARLSVVERVGVGVCGASGDGDAVLVGRRDRSQPGELSGLWEPLGWRADVAGGFVFGEWVGVARCARERIGVGRGLLAR